MLIALIPFVWSYGCLLSFLAALPDFPVLADPRSLSSFLFSVLAFPLFPGVLQLFRRHFYGPKQKAPWPPSRSGTVVRVHVITDREETNGGFGCKEAHRPRRAQIAIAVEPPLSAMFALRTLIRATHII